MSMGARRVSVYSRGTDSGGIEKVTLPEPPDALHEREIGSGDALRALLEGPESGRVRRES